MHFYQGFVSVTHILFKALCRLQLFLIFTQSWEATAEITTTGWIIVW